MQYTLVRCPTPAVLDMKGFPSDMQQEDGPEQKVERRSKFKKAMNALRVNYHLEIMDWDYRKDDQTSKVYFEARCLLHNMEVNLNLAWEKLKDLDKILDDFFKKCSCLVSAMQRLEKLEMGQENISQIESIIERKMQKIDQCHEHHLEKVDNKR